MANYMAEVAKMLGVELREEFECNDGTRCVFTSNGSFVVKHRASNSDASNHILGDLLMGVLTINRKPWKPKYGDYYWAVSANPTDSFCYIKWEGTVSDYSNYKLGNCYKTMSEAKGNKSKWVSFYASDEVLNVESLTTQN